ASYEGQRDDSRQREPSPCYGSTVIVRVCQFSVFSTAGTNRFRRSASAVRSLRNPHIRQQDFAHLGRRLGLGVQDVSCLGVTKKHLLASGEILVATGIPRCAALFAALGILFARVSDQEWFGERKISVSIKAITPSLTIGKICTIL